MTHNKVYEDFTKRMSVYTKQVIEWFPNGKDSIRVRFKDGKDYIYTIDESGFCFETKERFINRLKGVYNMRC